MDEEFPLRLYLLAQGEIASGFIPEWLLVWHYSQSPDHELQECHHASPQRRALAVRRHQPRFRHPLEVCLEGVRQAIHPQQRLVWCLQLLQHEAQAEILRLLAQPQLDSDLVGALTWTLAQYGRDIVLPIQERFPAALKSVRERYLQALWYLGREARGCERWLRTHDTPWARAVLYRLEDWGTELLMHWRAAPLYLNSASLEALAAMAFSLDGSQRWYALEALLGWGPALAQAAELLERLALDEDRDYARAALLGLRRLHYRPELKTLRSLLRTGRSDLARLAVEIFFEELPGADPETVEQAVAAVKAAPDRPLEYLLSELEPELLIKALYLLRRGGPSDQQIREFLGGLMARADLDRATLARALLAAGGSPRELLPYVKEESVAELLVQAASPDLLLEVVSHRSVRQQIRRQHKLLYALTSWPERLFAKLVDRLATIEPALLEELELNAIRWRGFSEFSDVQRQVAFSLIEFHQKFPEALAEELIQGRLAEAWPVRLLARFAPPEQRAPWLLEIWTGGMEPAAEEALVQLRELGEVGWREFSRLLIHPELALAGRALQILKGWAPAEQLLHQPCRTELQSELADWLILQLLPAGAANTPERVALALRLLPLAEGGRERLAAPLFRSRPVHELLELYPQYPHLRETILTWFRLWLPRGLAARMRQLAPDPEPRLVWLRLQLLHEIDRLNEQEISLLEQLASQSNDLQSELALLRRDYPAGPAPDN